MPETRWMPHGEESFVEDDGIVEAGFGRWWSTTCPASSLFVSRSMASSNSTSRGALEGTICTRSRTSVRRPVIAAAAAMAGDMRCVRPCEPCLFSKLRLLVLAQRSRAPRASSLSPQHILQPASRHWNPASRKIRCRPSFSAARRTLPEPGTTSARLTRELTVRPFATCAAARRSSSREFVQDPMKTTSISTSCMRVPRVKPM